MNHTLSVCVAILLRLGEIFLIVYGISPSTEPGAKNLVLSPVLCETVIWGQARTGAPGPWESTGVSWYVWSKLPTVHWLGSFCGA